MEWIKNLLQRISIIELFILLLVSTTVLLFNPLNIITTFKMTEFTNKYSLYFGIIFIISLSYLSLQLCKKVYIQFRRRVLLPRLLKKNIDNLSRDELQFIVNKFYDVRGRNFRLVSRLPFSSGMTTLLQNKGIVYWSGGNHALTDGFSMDVPYNLNPYARDYLQKKWKMV